MSRMPSQTRKGPGRFPAHVPSGASKLQRAMLKFKGRWQQWLARNDKEDAT